MPYRAPTLRPPRAPWTWLDAAPIVTAAVIFVASCAALVWVLA